MTVIITHAKKTGAPVNPAVLVDGATWDNDPHMVTGLAPSATTDATQAINITSGTTLGGTVTQALDALQGKPLFLFFDGQSNIERTLSLTWSPNPNVQRWNNPNNALGAGTAFAPLANTTINFPDAVASFIADAFPGRKVYTVVNSITGQPIAQWLPGATSPDMYANAVTNLTAALAAAGVSFLDGYIRWQGDADTGPLNTAYLANFTTMIQRYWAQAINGFLAFLQETPILVVGISSTAVSGNADGDHMNDLLQQCVAADPDTRRWFYPARFVGSTFWDNTLPGHMTALGYFCAGQAAATAFLRGPRGTLQNVTTDPVSGNVVVGTSAASSAKLAISNNTTPVLPTTGAMVQIAAADGASAYAITDSAGSGVFGGFSVRVAAGTLAAPTAVPANQFLASYGVQINYGSGAGNYTGNIAGLNFYKSGANASITDYGTTAQLTLTPPGTTTPIEVFGFNYQFSVIYGSGSGTGGGSFLAGSNGGSTAWAIGNTSAILGGAYDATGMWSASNNAYRLNWTNTGAVTSSSNGTLTTTAIGSANGLATLDGGGHLTSSQIPTSLTGALQYQGTWNATTNSPALVSGTGTKGQYYKVATAGTTTIDGNSQWNVGDSIVFDGTTWDKIDGVASEVVSVAGLFGVITAAGLKTAIATAIADISGWGTGVATALGNALNAAGGLVGFSGNLGTPTAGVATNLTGTAASLTAGNVTTNANLTGPVTSTGNATAIANNQITRAMEAQGVARSVVGVTGNATANVADIQLTASQFLGVNSGGTALAGQTMSGDATLSGAAITVTGINGVNQNTAWTSYTPTVTPGGGAFTGATIVATGRSKTLGKTIYWQADITLTALGSGSPIGNLVVTLPFTAAAFTYVGAVREHQNTGKSGAYVIPASGSTAVATDGTGTTFIAAGNIIAFTGIYEVP